MTIESYSKSFSDLIDPGTRIEKIAEGFIFTEGPVWNKIENRLLFSDIPANKIFSWSQNEGVQIYRSPSNYSNGLAFDQSQNLIACEHQSRSISSQSTNGYVKKLVDSYNGKKLNSPNDVIVSKDGSIIFTDPIYGLREGIGGPAKQELSFQGVFRIPLGGNKVELISDTFERPNGLALSVNEKRLFVNDTVRQHIRVFHISENWRISGGQVWAELRDDRYTGRPDGMKVDIKDNIFCTGPGGVWVFDKNASILGRIFLPDKTSNLAWGDKDRKSLFITSSSVIYRLQCKTTGM